MHEIWSIYMNINGLCNSCSPLYRRLMSGVEEHDIKHVKISFYFISDKTFILRQVTLEEEVTRLGQEGKLITAVEKGSQIYAYTSAKVANQLPEGIKIGDKKAKVEGLNEADYLELLKVSLLALNLLDINKNSNEKKEKADKIDEVIHYPKIHMGSESQDFIQFLSKVTRLSEDKIKAKLIQKMQQDRAEENRRKEEDNRLQDIKASHLKHDILKKEIRNGEIKKQELNLSLQKAEQVEKGMDLSLRDAEIKEQNLTIELTKDDVERHDK